MKDRIIDLRSRTDWNSVVDVAEPRIFLTDVVMKDVSATQIRLLASEGRFDELRQFVCSAGRAIHTEVRTISGII